MQVLPTLLNDVHKTIDEIVKNVKQSPISQGFETVYSSFIEEGKEQYTGVPQGFSTLEPHRPFFGREKIEQFKKALAKHDVHAESLKAIEEMVAQGFPLSLSKTFAVLSGESRQTQELSDSDAASFSQLAQKLGFSKEEAQGLINLSDEGKGMSLWQRLTHKLDEFAEDDLTIHAEEFSSLLKGLDISTDTRKLMEKTFAQTGQDTFNIEQIKSLISEAGNELAKREAATKTALRAMRPAMLEALEQADLNERSAPISDMRGSKKSILLEQRMKMDALRQVESEQGGLAAESTDEARLASPTIPTNEAERKPLVTPQKHITVSQALANAKESQGKPSAIVEKKPLTESRDFLLNGSQQLDPSDKESALNSDPHSQSDQNSHEFTQGKTGNNPIKNPLEQSTKASESAREFMDRIEHVGLSGAIGSASAFTANFDNSYPSAEVRQEIFSQVEHGILHHAANGAKQFSLTLNPENLGQLTVMLTMHQGELKAVIRADNPETAHTLQEQMAELRAALEENGIKVANIDVETRMAEDSSSYYQDGTRDHNHMYDAQERDRTARLQRLRKSTMETTAQDALQTSRATNSETGLHVVA